MKAAASTVAVALLLVAASLAGCTKKEWKCTACLPGSPERCANSSQYVENRTEAEARCSAGEELCSDFVSDEATFARICRGQAATRMMGCSDAFLGQLSFTCGAETKLSVPLPGVR